MSRYLPWLDLSMYIYMSRYLFTCLQITGCLCNYLYVFDCLLYLPVYEFACLSVYLPVYVFACLSTCLSMNLLVCICTWGCLWICLLVYVFACLCICLSMYLPVYEVYEFACQSMYMLSIFLCMYYFLVYVCTFEFWVMKFDCHTLQTYNFVMKWANDSHQHICTWNRWQTFE